MRTTVAKLALVAVFLIASVGVAVAPVLADGGAPFQPTDNRVQPLTGDKLAVYANPFSLDVLGIDSDNNGFYLTTFSAAELISSKPSVHRTANGTITLTLDQAPVTHIDFSTGTAVLVFDQNAAYHVTWTNGPDGADGSTPFVKTFNWGYDFNQLKGQ